MKNDAQAMNTTHTGTGTTVPVIHTATAPSTPMLSASAFFSDMGSSLDRESTSESCGAKMSTR
jgi:hypothetical protein